MYKKFVQILSYTVSFPTWGKKTRTRTCLCVYVCVCARAPAFVLGQLTSLTHPYSTSGYMEICIR